MKKRIIASILTVIMLMTMLPTAAFAAVGASENTYEVSTAEELSTALTKIAASTENEATIVLKADVTLSNDATSGYISSFGAKGKHITVKSDEGEMKKLIFPSYGVLTGDCTFDNVNVTGSRLFCNGYRTIFTENGQIHLSQTLYGGGYKTNVASTYVVIAASGSINPSSASGLHDVIGGSYQGSVEGDTYLEITGDIKMMGGNHLNPGCVKGDGTSGDATNIPDVYVGGNATLIYDNKNSTASPSIEGTYGCEMRGNVTLDIRSGRANEICGTQEFVDTSIIRGDLHIIAGSPDYENTDRTLRLNSNWPIVGAGNRFATYPGVKGNYTVGGNITIDTYENVWSWDKGVDPTTDHDKWDDIPEIYGAIRGNVGGSITINAHGSHVENITGASDSSTVGGDVTINATNVELKNCYYEDPDDDEGDILANYKSTVTGKCSVNVDGGDVNIVRLTNGKTVNEDSQITITGSPKIRTGVLSTTNYSSTPEYVTVTMTACNATIPFIQSATQVYVKNDSKVTLNGLGLAGDLTVDAGSLLKTDEDIVELTGSAVVNGTWEQLFTGATGLDYDTDVAGTMTVGSNGIYICHGSTRVSGDVSSSGMMALMKPSWFEGAYTGTNAELRLPVVQSGHNYNTGSIPLRISKLATGTTKVNIVKTDDWNTLQAPALSDNYILTKKDNDAPAQKVFLLGNEDALEKGYFLKRMPDAAGTDDHYMWQVASGIRVIFDKNGGDTEASPRIMSQEKVAGSANHFDLPTTNPTRTGYLFNGWNTKADGAGAVFTAETDVTDNMTVYAQWKPDEAYAVKIAPMNLTVYVGGDGYHGVIGDDGKFAANDLPEIGFYITLPDDINAMLGGTAENPVNLSGKLRLTSDDDNGTMHSWSLELYSDESKSHVMENGRRVYIYKLRQIDDGEETVPRVQFTRADGSVMTESKFQALLTDQFRNYKISVYQGLLDEQIYKATLTADGQTFTRPIKLGTGTLKVRGNNDTTYRAIENNTIPSVNPQEKDIMLVSTAQTGTQYYINNSGISVPSSDDVKLMVDHSLDDALLSAYINRTSNTEGKYSYQFHYLDLVDTSNGNTYVTMGTGQKMNLYWPVPSDAKSNSEFHIIHFKGIDRDSDADVNNLLTTRIPENLTCEKVTIDGQQFIKFTTDSFSPFALLYEKATSSGGGYSSGGGSSSSKYTLHYESNGGTSYKDESYSSGTTVTLDKAPVRESYTFTGWYADKALTDKITNVKMTGNKTVYAGWKATGVPDILNGDDHDAYVIGYPDGNVHPQGNISRAETATIFFRLLKADTRDGNLTAENVFADVANGKWFNKAVSTMAKLGIVKGRSAETFAPDAPITRAEFAAICARFNTKPTNTSNSFSDISGHWAEAEIERAVAFGWIAGYPDGTFRPDTYITRAEAMTMINRVLCRMPQSESDLLDSMVTWPDNKPSDWHYLAVQEATNSHEFERKGAVNEKWTKLTSAPDWTRYQ